MLTEVDEFELSRLPPSGGIYAFHVRLIRRATVGLITGQASEHELLRAKSKLLLLIDRLLALETRSRFSGGIREIGHYEHHGRLVELQGSVTVTEYLKKVINKLPWTDVPQFIRVLEAVPTFLPPLYIGITLDQTLQSRYEQHKRAFSAGPSDDTFGGRIAASGLAWNDLIFSVAPQPNLRLTDTAVELLEDYLQYFSRPKLGKA
jgi:hypothetical protein